MSEQQEHAEARLAERLAAGDKEALATLFDIHRGRLARVAGRRLDARLVGRVDSDDVLQEAWLAALSRLTHFDHRCRESPFLWLQMILGQTLTDIHRRHLGTRSRDAKREVPMPDSLPGAGNTDRESARQLYGLLDKLPPIDREILLLRHFDELTNTEIACALGLSRTAASNRYVRAIARLRSMLTRNGEFAAVGYAK